MPPVTRANAHEVKQEESRPLVYQTSLTLSFFHLNRLRSLNHLRVWTFDKENRIAT